MILAMDPSSTRTGLAALCVDRGQATLVDAWAITPDLRGRAAQDATQRLGDMRTHLEAAIRDCAAQAGGVSQIVGVVEIPGSGQAGKMRQRAASLAVYAFAAGYQASILAAGCRRMIYAPSSQWTRLGGGRAIPKDRRLALVAAHPAVGGRYAPSADPGGDIGDAIALGLWAAARL